MTIKSVEQQLNEKLEQISAVHEQVHTMLSGLNLLINNLAYAAVPNLPQQIRDELVEYGQQVTQLQALIQQENEE